MATQDERERGQTEEGGTNGRGRDERKGITNAKSREGLPRGFSDLRNQTAVRTADRIT
jgi:hypothetical protein